MTPSTHGFRFVVPSLAAFVVATLSGVGTGYVSAAKDAAQGEADPVKHLLQYKFASGETVRWDVEHRATVRTTVSGTTQTANTVSKSVKIWHVTDVAPDGSTTFVHSVESVDMQQETAGRQAVRYNSDTDEKAPLGFEDVAKQVGIPLAEITINAAGKVLKREQKVPQPNATGGEITLPLPDKAVPVGHVWTLPDEVRIPAQNGRFHTIKTRQKFTLEGVKNGVATIHVETQVLTPIDDPAVEAQLIQRESRGYVRFDLEKGRIIGQQMDLDKQVHGFQGNSSLLHYQTRFVEKLLPENVATARRDRKETGPALPPETESE